MVGPRQHSPDPRSRQFVETDRGYLGCSDTPRQRVRGVGAGQKWQRIRSDMWWLCVYLMVVVPPYLVAHKIFYRAGVLFWLPFAIFVGFVEFVWYALSCAGSW
jgi:hypothetical protein